MQWIAQIASEMRDLRANIKPGDAMVVGMFPKNKDQVKENAGTVRSILGKR
jgi:translation initiation factor IF-1